VNEEPGTFFFFFFFPLTYDGASFRLGICSTFNGTQLSGGESCVPIEPGSLAKERGKS
jgi:hypothetical protein